MSEPRSGGHTAESHPLRHGDVRKKGPVAALFTALGVLLTVVVVSSLSVAGIAFAQLNNEIEGIALLNEGDGPPPAIGSFEGGFNVLVVGIDKCEDPAGCPGRTAELNDVNILVHVSEDQTNVTAVSLPRDLIVPIPSCPKEDGSGNHSAMSARPLNEAQSYGGLACVVLTVEKLTGLTIPFAGLITFNGVVEMSTAVGGVKVCINGPIVDPGANGLNLPKAGEYNLQGVEALGFLRTRYGVGDGSDLGRISNQQVYLSSLMRKVKSEGVLSDPATLFRIATTAANNMQLSNSLKSIPQMVSMAQVLKNIELDKIKFVQYPGTTGHAAYPGKVVPNKALADKLFAKLLADEPFELGGETGSGSVPDPNAPQPETPPVDSAAPADPAVPSDPSAPSTPDAGSPDSAEVLSGVLGQSAADQTCSKANR